MFGAETMATIGQIGDVLGLASTAKSLLGGDEGRSARKQMADQHFFSLKNAEDMPVHMVKGMRAAGLNPMLVATKGFTPGQMPTSGVQDDRAIGLQKASAQAVIANQAAQARLYNAQAQNVEADTQIKLKQPANVEADTRLKDENATLAKLTHATETERARLLAAQAGSEEVRLAVQRVVASPMAVELLKQAQQQTEVGSLSAKQAASFEAALKKLPAELLAAVRIIQSIFRPGISLPGTR